MNVSQSISNYGVAPNFLYRIEGVPYKEAELFLQNARPDLQDGTIVECGYGALGWFVEKVRTDKTHANNRRTYFRTIVNIRENIQLGEFTTLYHT